MVLAGQVALVTGGGRAIGKCISLRLARDGADVCITSPDCDELEETAAEIRALGRRAEPLVADVTREDQMQTAVARASESLGPIDILINNSGIAGPTAAVGDVELDDWNEVLAVNLTGAFLTSKAVAPRMIERRRGRIVNISSIAGKIGYPLRSPYAASKWGMIGLTLTLAKELGPHGISVNAICPGPVEGERMQRVIEGRAAEIGKSVEEVHREYLQQTVLGRMVTADDVAATVAFLAGPEGANITGQALEVAAGYAM